jgi:hypothetical protein
MVRWLAHVLGIDSTTSNYYAFWSGFGGRSFGLGFVAALFFRHHKKHHQ